LNSFIYFTVNKFGKKLSADLHVFGSEADVLVDNNTLVAMSLTAAIFDVSIAAIVACV